MKKLVIIMMLLAFVGVNVAIAADSYTYDNKKGTVTFDHKAHQDALGDCAKCHEGEPAKIAVDKKAAQTGQWRTPENSLHMLSLFGGWPGALFAQNQLRHKSKKQPFKAILWFTIILNISAFLWTFTPSGVTVIQRISSVFY